MAFEPWPRADREHVDASWPPRREAEREVERQVLVSTWPPGDEHDREHEDEQGHDDWPRARLTAWQEWRMLTETAGSMHEHIDYAIGAAYARKAGWWRTANIIDAYTIGAVIIFATRGCEWCFARGITRRVLSVLVGLASGWALNHVPVLAWLTPDWLDPTTWWAPDTATVTVPIDASFTGGE